MLKFFSIVGGIGLALSTGAADWAYPEYTCRTPLDLQTQQYPNQAFIEVQIDAQRFARAQGWTAARPNFALAVQRAGQSTPLQCTLLPHTPGEVNYYLRFRMPEKFDHVHLYFGGKKTLSPGTATANDLLAGALNPTLAKRWKPTGKGVKFVPQNGQWHLKLTRAPNQANKFYLGVKRTFKIPDHIAPGSPVQLALDGVSNSSAMWPLELNFKQRDAQYKLLGETIIDPRWTAVLMPTQRQVRFRQAGKLDPRARYIELSIMASHNGQAKLYDAFGQKIADSRSILPQLTVSRLELRAAYPVTVPGSNPQLYGAGDRPGTTALNMLGHTAFMFNNFPASVWGGYKKVNSKERFYWPLDHGTLELRLQGHWGKSSVVLVDHCRYRKKSFLTLSYLPKKQQLKLAMHDYHQHALQTAIACSLPAGKWHHLAVTWSSQSGVALYCNGQRIYRNEQYRPAALPEQLGKIQLAEYTVFGADGQRFMTKLNQAHKLPFFRGQLDSIRISEVLRYTKNFVPSTVLPIDQHTVAAFDFERHYDGVSNRAARWISGTIYAADVPPRADVLNVEYANGTKKSVRYVPREIPQNNMPQNILTQTAYPVLPSPADFTYARESHSFERRVKPQAKFTVAVPPGAVMNYVEIKCPHNVPQLVAPLLRKSGEIDPRSFGDIAQTLNFRDCPNDHAKVRRAFDFLITSSDYFTFQGAEFAKGSDFPHSAEFASLLAINSYAAFECGPLNGLAVGLLVNGLKFPAVFTFGNWHLFQQVMLNDQFRVFDLSAQQYFPSRNQDDAASLDDIEKDIYLLARTKRPVSSGAHYFRMIRRGRHEGTSLPPEHLSYTLYPGEAFRYYWSNNGSSNDLNVPGWGGKAKRFCQATWRDVQRETGAKSEIGQVAQRPLPHIATGMFLYSGAVRPEHGAFKAVNAASFIYRLDSPYTIISGTYQIADASAKFEISTDYGKTWRVLPSRRGVCRVDLPLRGRHAADLRVTTPHRENFTAQTVVQLNPRRLTGGVTPGSNAYQFSARQGEAQIRVAYRVPVKKLAVSGGYYFGTIPGAERQLFLQRPGTTQQLPVTGASPQTQVRTVGNLHAQLVNGVLTLQVPPEAPRQMAAVELRDGKARKFLEVLICPQVLAVPLAELPGFQKLAVSQDRVQVGVKGRAEFKLPQLVPGKYLIFSLVRKNNLQSAYMQVYIYDDSGKTWVGARIRNPGTDYYKARYGTGQFSRYRWDFLTRKNINALNSFIPQRLEFGKKSQEKIKIAAVSGECAGMFILPADDRDFVYQIIRNLTSLNRADYLYQFGEK